MLGALRQSFSLRAVNCRRDRQRLSMLIRRGTSADIPDVMALERRAPAAAHWSREQYQNIFSFDAPSRVLLILKQATSMQGFIVGRALDNEWEIENLVVPEAMRRRGFGSRLLQEFLLLARGRGAKEISLEVRESNDVAQKLYRKYGFTTVSTRPGHYRDISQTGLALWAGSRKRVLSPPLSAEQRRVALAVAVAGPPPPRGSGGVAVSSPPRRRRRAAVLEL